MKHRILEGNDILGTIQNNYKGVNHIYICSPFMTLSAIQNIFDILKEKQRIDIDIITKWDPVDLALGVSDIIAFEYIFKKKKYKKWNIEITVVKNLHAKAIILGKKTAIIGSANITYSGLNKNKELCIGLFEEDSKIITLIKKLDQIKKTGHSLTSELFEWKRLHENKHQKHLIDKLIALRKELEKEKEQYLQSFIQGKSNTKNMDYLGGVRETLMYVSKTTPSRKKLVNWLKAKAKKHGDSISDHRVQFLGSLSLIYEDSAGINITSMGQRTIKEDENTNNFYDILSSEYSGFNELETYLLTNKRVHPSELSIDKNIFGKEQYWAKRLRWLESMKLVIVEKGKQNRKYYSINRENEYWEHI